jgi:hypothetical protein
LKNILRGILFLILSLAVGEVVKRLLTTRAGEAAMARIGRPELATMEGAHAAGKEAKRVVGFVRSLTQAKGAAPMKAIQTELMPGWVSVARDASEMLLAAGALIKTAADFAGEDEKLRRRVARPGPR